jgi:hypothetical protein
MIAKQKARREARYGTLKDLGEELWLNQEASGRDARRRKENG